MLDFNFPSCSALVRRKKKKKEKKERIHEQTHIFTIANSTISFFPRLNNPVRMLKQRRIQSFQFPK